MMFPFLKSGDLVNTTQIMSFPRIGYKRQYSFYLGHSLLGPTILRVSRLRLLSCKFLIEKKQRLRRQKPRAQKVKPKLKGKRQEPQKTTHRQ